jgi:phosphate transport system substrate-binding protein
VKLQRYGVATGAALLAAAVLSACGSNNTTSSSTTTSGAAGSGGATSAITCASGTLAMAGSTAQANAISKWVTDYQTACGGATINYNPSGSGAGDTAFNDKQATVAGSDYALSSTQQTQGNARCAPGTAANIPMVPGAIAVIYNVPGVPTGLKLSATVLGQIFSGSIKNWNDAAIKAANPSVTLPSLPIQSFHRSDTSGTSYNFSNYLHSVAPSAWASAANKQWPSTTGQGQKGSAALAQAVKSTSGGIGYAEYSYATSDSLNYAEVGNAAGAYVPLTQANAANFVAKATVTQSGANTTLKFDYTDTAATDYPATLITYEFVCTSGAGALAKDFLTYTASSTAQGELTSLGYVPLPADLLSKVQAAVKSLS